MRVKDGCKGVMRCSPEPMVRIRARRIDSQAYRETSLFILGWLKWPCSRSCKCEWNAPQPSKQHLCVPNCQGTKVENRLSRPSCCTTSGGSRRPDATDDGYTLHITASQGDGKGLHTLSINQSLHGVRKPSAPLTATHWWWPGYLSPS